MFWQQLLFVLVIFLLWMCTHLDGASSFAGNVLQNDAKNKLICENAVSWAKYGSCKFRVMGSWREYSIHCSIAMLAWISCMEVWLYPGGGGDDLAKFRISMIHRFMTSGCRVAALFSREAQRWTPDAIWFLRYFNPQAKGIMYLECRECWEGI